MKELTRIVIGMVLVAAVVFAVVHASRSASGVLDFNRYCPVAGARCSATSDAALSGCHQ